MADGESQYRAALRAAVRGLWGGAMDYGDFYDAMDAAIERGFTAAQREGAAECGISPDEMTTDEKKALQSAIVKERGFIDGFAEYIEAHDKAHDGKLEPLFSRVNRWVDRYNDVRNRAKLMACGDKKLEWVLGMYKKEHCPSCIKLAGVIKRASFWQEHDVRPQHPTKLQCMIAAGGVSVCGCGFRETDRHCTPGPLPKLP